MIGTIIKMEIKSEVKIELDRINTRHKYKNTKFPTNVNYIHADYAPCKSAKRKANELPDLPPVEDPSRTTDTIGLAVETLSRTPIDTTSEDTVNDEVNIPNKPDKNTTDGLPAETDQNAGLVVETTTDNTPGQPVQIITPIEANKSNEDNKGLLAETTIQASGDKTKEKENTNSDEPSTIKQLNNEPNKRTSDNEKDLGGIIVSEAALGLVMLQDNNPTVNSLLQKYDNSSLMPVGATRRTDYSKIHDSELANNDNDTGNDSDDTVILQQEIEDTIGESSNNHTNSDTLDTSSITKDLSKLSVTPVSPNRGKVVFKSYRLWRRATNNETSDRLKDMNIVSNQILKMIYNWLIFPPGIPPDHLPRINIKSGNSRSIRCVTIHVCIAISTSN